jgi:hypothetical protein
MVPRWISAVLFLGALAAPVHGAEIEIRHINDQFSASRIEDDLYTGTLGISGTVAGWTFDLDEYIFTDKTNGLRFDETYLTVAKEFLGPDSPWRVRARLGAVHVGEGLYGQDFQNFVHSILNQPEVHLPYVTDSMTDVFARLNVGRRLYSNERVFLDALMEIEYAGFKEHARVAVGAHWNLGKSFGLHAEAGARFSDTDYAPLVPWIEETAPTFAIGAGYKHYVDLTWTHNYFGTGDNHWIISARARFGAAAKKPD